MSWPLSHDFNEAVQTPQLAFQDPDLKGGETVVGATGLPLPRSGNFADVYQVRGADGREWAVKCFTRPVVGLAERYAKISDALARSELPFTVGFTYLADGIRVNGAWRPIVKMEWVEGLLLNQVVRDNAGSVKVLTALGAMWAKLCKRLREANVAHADVQHGNVLLVPGSRPGAYGLKLIDYDGMWVKALANTPSGESGHPSYQHPGRASGRVYSPDVDRFPHLAIAAVIRGLVAGGSALWDKYDNGDNLLFTEVDYKNPAASAAMRDLWNLGDPVAEALVGRLAIACGKPVPQTPWLDHVAPDGDPAPLDDATRREAAAALGMSLPVPAALPPEPAPVVADWAAPPLPPEPPPAPAFEVVPEPAFTLDPEPVVTARRAPLKPKVVIEEDDADVELVQEGRRDRSAKRGRPKDRPQGGNGRVLLFVGGGLLLLLGGVVAGVMIGGRSKPPETAQKQKGEPSDPPPKVTDEPRPKANPRVEPPARPPVVAPPVDPPLNPPAAPADPLPPVAGAPKLLWSQPSNSYLSRLVVSGRRVFGTPVGGRPHVLDLEKGARSAAFGEMEQTQPHELFPLAGGGVASWTVNRDVHLWDESGRSAGTIKLFGGPPKPAEVAGGQPYVTVSPNGRYCATSWVSGGFPKFEPGQALQIHDTKGEKVLNLTWAGGAVLFTPDSSRMLVADRSGKCRWHKLPSGAQDGPEWDFGPPRQFHHEITSVSADGSVLAYFGPLGVDRGVNAATIDGASGRVLQSFPGTKTVVVGAPVVSGDGRRIATHRADPTGVVTVDVADARTGARLVAVPTDARRVAYALSEDGKVLVVSSNEPPAVRAYDLDAGAAVAAKPPEPEPVPPAPMPPAAGAKLEVREKWAVDLPTNFHLPHFAFTADLTTLVAVPNNGSPLVLEAATGKALATGPKKIAWTTKLQPLTGGQIALVPFSGTNTIPVVDFKTGATTTVPGVVAQNSMAYQFVSPNQQYVAGGVANSPEPAPFKFKVTSAPNPFLEFDWVRGNVFFTADSKRALIAESSGRCQWIDLTTGKREVEWKLEPAKVVGPNGLGLFAASADGSVLLFDGVIGGHPGEYHVIDGRTGEIRRSLSGYAYQRGSMSADGRLAALPRRAPGGKVAAVHVIDLGTGAVLAEVPAPAGSDFIFPTLLPNGRGMVVHVEKRLVRYDFVGAGGAAGGPAPMPAAPGEPVVLKPKWSQPLPAQPYYPVRYANDATGLILMSTSAASATPGPPLVYELKTGKPRAGFGGATGALGLVRMDKGRVASHRVGASELVMWDERTGAEVGRLAVPPLPPLPPPADKDSTGVRLTPSPNGAFVASGWTTLPRPNGPDLPFRVFNVATKKAIVTTEWKGGSVLFTADSSRVLVAEYSGRCRWFKLPGGGDPVAEWQLEGDTANGREHKFTGLSADGALIAYSGPNGRPSNSSGPAVLDGETGKAVHRFPIKEYDLTDVAISADGKRVALQHKFVDTTSSRIDVADARTGAILGTATIEFGSSTWALPGDGAWLVVFAHQGKRLHAYDLNAALPPARPMRPRRRRPVRAPRAGRRV